MRLRVDHGSLEFWISDVGVSDVRISAPDPGLTRSRIDQIDQSWHDSTSPSMILSKVRDYMGQGLGLRAEPGSRVDRWIQALPYMYPSWHYLAMLPGYPTIHHPGYTTSTGTRAATRPGMVVGANECYGL